MSSYLALKIGYINKTHTHTQSRAENSLFQFWLTITKPFSPFYLKKTTNYWSLSAWWANCLVSRAVSPLIMLVNKSTFADKLALQLHPRYHETCGISKITVSQRDNPVYAHPGLLQRSSLLSIQIWLMGSNPFEL